MTMVDNTCHTRAVMRRISVVDTAWSSDHNARACDMLLMLLPPSWHKDMQRLQEDNYTQVEIDGNTYPSITLFNVKLLSVAWQISVTSVEAAWRVAVILCQLTATDAYARAHSFLAVSMHDAASHVVLTRVIYNVVQMW